MKRLFTTTLIFGIAVIGWRDVTACGDKFMIPGRGMTFLQAYKPGHVASVVIYAPSLKPADVLATAKVESLLALVGHRVNTVRTEIELTHRLATVKTDIVLTDLADAATLVVQAQLSPNRPTVVPVMAKKADAKAVKTQYAFQLRNGDDEGKFLATIDSVMKQRVKAN
jgi:hypothetical protein